MLASGTHKPSLWAITKHETALSDVAPGAHNYVAVVPTAKDDRSALRARAMYDWANSAYSTVVAGAVLPAFFVDSVWGLPRNPVRPGLVR